MDRFVFLASFKKGDSGGMYSYLRFRARFPSRTLPSLSFPVPAPTRMCPFALPTSTLCRARAHNTRSQHVHHPRRCPRLRAPAPSLGLRLLWTLLFHNPNVCHPPLPTRVLHARSAVTECSLLQPVSYRSQDLTFTHRSTTFSLHKTSLSRAFPLFAQLRLL